VPLADVRQTFRKRSFARRAGVSRVGILERIEE
jgi:hypothetical protein